MFREFTEKERDMVSKFFNLYMTGLAIEKGIETQEEFDELIIENTEEATDLVAMFKATKFPNSEMTSKAFAEFTSTICIQTFEQSTIKKVMKMINNK